MVVQKPGREAVEQIHRAPQFVTCKAPKYRGKLPLFLLLVGGKQPFAGFGERKTDLASIGLSFLTTQQFATDQLVDGFASGGVAYAQEHANVVDCMGVG